MTATATSPFGEMAKPSNHDAVCNARWIEFEIDHAHRIDATVGLACVAVVGCERYFAARRYVDIVWPLTRQQIELAVSHFIAVDVEQGDLVVVEFGHQCALAIRCKYGMRDNAAKIDGIYHFDIGAFDR